MSKPGSKQIEVQIMGQSYLLSCPPGGEASLLDAVERVDSGEAAIAAAVARISPCDGSARGSGLCPSGRAAGRARVERRRGRRGGGRRGRRVQEDASLDVLLHVLGAIEVERVQQRDPVQGQVVPDVLLHPLPQDRLRPRPFV